ncbi:MAG TPA: hypothetical protein QGF05_13320, partial [Dehalococcoidia bacterium]|nr:hypothetical protein [Dehalococcoidia bacterium]
PTFWGRPLLPVGPYAWLAEVVPGLDGLRVPARLGMVVFLALSVLAAMGAARLLNRLPRWGQVLLVIGLTCGVLADGYGGFVDVQRFPAGGRAEERAVSDWVRERPPGALLHLPFGGHGFTRQTLEQQYQTLFHRRPVVNGFSGYAPALQRLLSNDDALDGDPDLVGDVVTALRSLGVRYVAVHERDYAPGEGIRIAEAIQRSAGPLLEDTRLGQTRVLRLAEPAVVPTVPSTSGLVSIASDSFRAVASGRNDRLEHAFDREPWTRWMSGTAQTGSEWLEIRFRHPTDLALLRMETAPLAETDFPRGLLIESSTDLETFETLYEGRVIQPLFLGLVHEPRRGPIEIPLPPNRSLLLRIRQTGTSWFQWSITELRLWRR